MPHGCRDEGQTWTQRRRSDLWNVDVQRANSGALRRLAGGASHCSSGLEPELLGQAFMNEIKCNVQGGDVIIDDD